MTETNNIVAIFLAAGLSSRAGQLNKLLTYKDGKSLLTHSLENAMAAGLHCCVVVGAEQDRLKVVIPESVVTVNNPDYKTGLSSSIKKGIENLNSTTELAFLCLADMPFINSSTYHQLLEAALKYPEKEIFIPTNKGRQGNPVLWRRSLFKSLMGINGDKGGKQLFQSHAKSCIHVEVNNPGIHIDMDTEETLKNYGFMEEAP